jgi:SAM-dependent methyltransferase
VTSASGVPLVWSAVAIAAAAAGSGALFLLELIAGKILLPRFGGAPGVWVSCLAFFQVALVAATLYADRLIRLRRPRLQLAVQAGVFALAAVVAPLGLVAALSLAGPESPLPLALLVVVVLALGVGPVFFAVATLSPIFGHWRSLWPDIANDQVTGGQAAYGLYAAGNAGSFAILAAYPTLIEPLAGIEQQVAAASRLFLAVAVLMLVVGGFTVFFTRRQIALPSRPVTSSHGTWSEWLTWALFAAVPASWLASVTTHATVEVAPIPLLWVVPLAVYLASFVVVFSSFGRRLQRFEGPALLVTSAVAIWMVAADTTEPAMVVLAFHIIAFAIACVCIHGLLVDRRPPPERLSSFYLAMAVGGACGGLWNALVAPAIFDAHHEFPLAIAAAAGLAPAAMRLRPPIKLVAIAIIVVVVGGVLALSYTVLLNRWIWLAVLALAVAVPAVALVGIERTVAFFALALATFFVDEATGHVVHRERTFFGVLRVRDSSNGPSRILMHGGIRHGVQLVSDDPDRRRIPLAYYAEAGPLGSIFRGLEATGQRTRVGVAGLGIGTVASYARSGDDYVFFEIDPAVARIAEDTRWFTYLADCKGRTRVVIDDARHALEAEPDGSLDLLVIDAFTGDSVPTHLLTREAFALYSRKLNPDGVLALHVSNKYLDFVPVVEAIAADGGWMGVYARDVDVDPEAARIPSEWMALSRSLDSIKAIYANPTSERWRWQPVNETPSARPWTDDRTAVIEALLSRFTVTPQPLPQGVR